MFATRQQAEAFLINRRQYGIKPGLDRMRHLLRLAGDPQRRLKAVHIAGTNGKGSTAALLSSALIHNGYRTGTFLSPTPDSYESGILINQQPMSETAFLARMNELYPFILKLDEQEQYPSEFEIHVCIAFLHLAAHTDIAVIEAGMGGAGDATNCIEPIISIITNVGLDHQRFLGDSIGKIAEEKAGIIKWKTPIITAARQKEALAAIQKRAEQERAPLYPEGKAFSAELQNNRWVYRDKEEAFGFELKLKGAHQGSNAALAIQSCRLLSASGFNLKKENTLTGIKNAYIAGRFEVISENPAVILDGAHNTEGMKTFSATIRSYYPNKRIVTLFAAFRDKPFTEMLHELQQVSEKVIAVSFDHPRAASVNEIEEGSFKMKSNTDWKQALKEELAALQDDQIICVTGSLHFIYLVRDYFVKNPEL